MPEGGLKGGHCLRAKLMTSRALPFADGFDGREGELKVYCRDAFCSPLRRFPRAPPKLSITWRILPDSRFEDHHGRHATDL